MSKVNYLRELEERNNKEVEKEMREDKDCMKGDISMFTKCAWKSDDDIKNHFKKVVMDCRKSEKYYNKNCRKKIKNEILKKSFNDYFKLNKKHDGLEKEIKANEKIFDDMKKKVDKIQKQLKELEKHKKKLNKNDSEGMKKHEALEKKLKEKHDKLEEKLKIKNKILKKLFNDYLKKNKKNKKPIKIEAKLTENFKVSSSIDINLNILILSIIIVACGVFFFYKR